MMWLTIFIYAWAGVTVVYALWLFEGIGQAINMLLPEAKHIKAPLRKHRGAIVLLLLFWPAVLPIWAYFEKRSN
jgi:hypothetical protein